MAEFKSFATEAGARRALRTAGLHLLPVTFGRGITGGRVVPCLKTETNADAAYIRNQYNFKAWKRGIV